MTIPTHTVFDQPLALRDKRVAVIGLARTGLACVRFLVSQGAQVVGADSKPATELADSCHEVTSLGAAAMAAGLGALSASHLEYLDEADVPRLAAGGTTAVLLPVAAYVLREPHRPPVEALRLQSIPMAVATDGNPGTAPCFSLLTALNMACVLFGLTPEEALAGATVHAARALGLLDRIGTIEAGKDADLVLWDAESPVELVYTLGYHPSATVIKRGRVLSGA